MEKSDTILWVGKLPRDITNSELDREFNKFGKIIETQMRNGYAFVEFDSPKDAKNAQAEMDGFKFDKYPISVQFKEDRKRGTGRGGPTATDICFNCGKQGHWANECRENDWRSRRSSKKCRYCGKFGHSERECRYRSITSSSSRSSRRSSSRHKKFDKSRKYRKSRSYSSSKSRSRSPKRNQEKAYKKRKNSSRSRSSSSRSKKK